MNGVIGREVMLMARGPRSAGCVVSERRKLRWQCPRPALQHLLRGHSNLRLPRAWDLRSLQQRGDAIEAGRRVARYFASDDRDVEIIAVERPGDTVVEIVR